MIRILLIRYVSVESFMKHRIFVNEKPITDITPEERKQMDIAIAKAFKDVFGLIIPLDESKYVHNEDC